MKMNLLLLTSSSSSAASSMSFPYHGLILLNISLTILMKKITSEERKLVNVGKVGGAEL